VKPWATRDSVADSLGCLRRAGHDRQSPLVALRVRPLAAPRMTFPVAQMLDADDAVAAAPLQRSDPNPPAREQPDHDRPEKSRRVHRPDRGLAERNPERHDQKQETEEQDRGPSATVASPVDRVFPHPSLLTPLCRSRRSRQRYPLTADVHLPIPALLVDGLAATEAHRVGRDSRRGRAGTRDLVSRCREKDDVPSGSTGGSVVRSRSPMRWR
jgi:hypothetical protein